MCASALNESYLSQISTEFHNRNTYKVAEIRSCRLEDLRGRYELKRSWKDSNCLLDFSGCTKTGVHELKRSWKDSNCLLDFSGCTKTGVHHMLYKNSESVNFDIDPCHDILDDVQCTCVGSLVHQYHND